MTQGEWQHDHEGDIFIGDDGIATTDWAHGKYEANAHAITSAVNGTYGAGIDPAKVGEMYDMLGVLYSLDLIPEVVGEKLKALLTSAKLPA